MHNLYPDSLNVSICQVLISVNKMFNYQNQGVNFKIQLYNLSNFSSCPLNVLSLV